MKNHLLGSTLIVAGTTLGAGMLALPLITAEVGWGLSIILMLLIWAVSAAGGLLLAEVSAAYPDETNLHGMAGAILGKPGQWVSGAASMFLYYSLCAAYISGTSAQLQLGAEALFGYDLSGSLAAIIAAVITAVLVSSGTERVDGINRVLFPLMLVALAVVLVVVVPYVKPANMESEPANLTVGVVFATLPILYTSFGFHVVVPTISNYLDVNHKAVRKAVLVGSLIPVIVYLLWQIGVNGVLGSQQLHNVTGDPVTFIVTALVEKAHVHWISTAISAFAVLALITSFLGVALGLFDYLNDACAERNIKGRLPVMLVTFVPPLTIALISPDSFVAALGFAALALVFLAAFLPAAMVWKIRKQNRISFIMVGLVVGGLLIAGAQIAVATGFLEAVG